MTLIGATTENPYFEVNSALLSRTHVYELDALGPADMRGAARPGRVRGASAAPAAGVDERSARVPGRALGRRRAHRAERARARLRGGRRGRQVTLAHAEDALQRRALLLRPPGRPPLRHDLGLDQGHPGLGSRRLAVLPGGDARGRRGPAVHRPADGHPRLRGHRQRRPAGADVATAAAAAVEHVGLPECQFALAQAAIYLSLAPKSDAAKRAVFAARELHPRARRRPAAGAPALLDAQRRRLRQPASAARSSLAAGADARPRDRRAFYEPDDAEAALRERLEEIRQARGRS